LYSNLGSGGSVYSNAGWTISGSGTLAGENTEAFDFTVSGSGAYAVTQVDFGVVYFSTPDPFTASLWTDNSGLPGTELASWSLTPAGPLGTCCSLSTQTGITGVTVTGGARYWMVVSPQDPTDSSMNGWAGNSIGAMSNRLWSHDGGASWTIPGASQTGAFDVLGPSSTVPEPGSLALAACGLAALAVAFRRRSAVNDK
jgi:hypothetical protein